MTRDRRGPFSTAKGPRDFLLNFHHPKIPLRLVIAKRAREVVQESENLLGSGQKRIQKILRIVLFAATRLFGNRSFGRRGMHPMKSKALLKNRKILENERVAFCLRKPMRSHRAKPSGGVARLLQKVIHLLRPGW